MALFAWDEWRGDFDGRVVMQIKNLLSWRGWKVDLHRIIDTDSKDCYHSHPAKAFRLIFTGGYIEEVVLPKPVDAGGLERRAWWPGRCGIIQQAFIHRIDALPRGPSYSLWIRAPKTAEINLVGKGWNREQR